MHNSDLGLYEFSFVSDETGIHYVSINIENEYLNFIFNSTVLITVTISNDNDLEDNIVFAVGLLLIIGIISWIFVQTNSRKK